MVQEPEPVDIGLPVGEAAARLGITVPALRKRIRRGSVTAHKVDGIWRVTLPVAGSAGTPADTPRGGLDSGQDAVITELRARIEEQREHIGFLERLTEHQAGMIADLAQRLPELPAGGSPVTNSSQATPVPTNSSEPVPTPPRRPWWRFW